MFEAWQETFSALSQLQWWEHDLSNIEYSGNDQGNLWGDWNHSDRVITIIPQYSNTTNSIGRESVYNKHVWQYGFLSRSGALMNILVFQIVQFSKKQVET